MAVAPELAGAMLAAKTMNWAYETVRDNQGQLPPSFLRSEVAGRMAVQIGAHFPLSKLVGSVFTGGTRCSKGK